MKYNIQTTSDHSYFNFLKIFVNSILTNCNLEHLNKIYIINTGMTDDEVIYLTERSNHIEIIETGLKTNFKGGTWGEDWQLNVKGKTHYLYELVSKIEDPLLMLDSDMMIVKDLYPKSDELYPLPPALPTFSTNIFSPTSKGKGTAVVNPVVGV